MKSKLTITIASILSVLVLVGVGFAAWVIINPNVNKETESSITAEGVTDKSYTLEAAFAPDEKIVFGAPETMDNTNAWFTADEKTEKEDLEAKLTLTLKYKDWGVVPTEFSVTMKTKNGEAADKVFDSLRDGTDTDLGELANKNNNFIANPKIAYGSTTADVTMNGGVAVTIKKDEFKQSTSNSEEPTAEKTATLDITITFGWGTYFTVVESESVSKVVNPYIFYNKKNYEDARVEANNVINAIAKLNTVKYVVTISGTTNVSGK